MEDDYKVTNDSVLAPVCEGHNGIDVAVAPVEGTRTEVGVSGERGKKIARFYGRNVIGNASETRLSGQADVSS